MSVTPEAPPALRLPSQRAAALARTEAEQRRTAALRLVREATDRYWAARYQAELLRLDQAEAIRRAIAAGASRRAIAPHATKRGRTPISRRHVDRLAAHRLPSPDGE